jgi:hypothetical protein
MDVTSHSCLVVVGVSRREVADLPRFQSFKVVEFETLEHRSSWTNGYHTIVH